MKVTPFSSNLVLPSEKAILEVVSGALLMQTNIFIRVFLRSEFVPAKVIPFALRINAHL
jgi:hypothetical protein